MCVRFHIALHKAHDDADSAAPRRALAHWQHAARQRHQRPAAVARLETLHVDVEEVVIGQVDIDDELALHRLEELELLVVARRGRREEVGRPYFNVRDVPLRAR